VCLDSGVTATVVSSQFITLLPGATIKRGANGTLRIASEGEDPTLVNNTFALASIADRTLCQNQTLALDAGVDAASYNWSSSNGFSSNQRNIVVSQAGNYTLTAISYYGVTKSINFNIAVNNEALKAEFLVSTVVNAGDTVYVIDVTKPTPTNINWTLPTSNTTILNSTNPHVKQIVFNLPGTYTLSLTTGSGECLNTITKTVTVLEKEKKAEVNVALGYNPEIKSVGLYPNPNTGQFNVDILLAQTDDVKVRYFNGNNNQLIEIKTDIGKDNYSIPFSHAYLTPGVYFVTVEVGNVVKTFKVI